MFSGPFGFPGIYFFFEIVGSALMIAFVVGIVFFLVRSDAADVRGRRPYAAYLFVVMFFSLLTLLGASGALSRSLGVAITHTGGGGSRQCTFSDTAESIAPPAEGQAPGIVTVSPVPGGSIPAPQFSFRPRVLPPPRPVPVQRCFSIGASGQGAAASRAGIVAGLAAAILAFHAGQARRLIAKEVSGA